MNLFLIPRLRNFKAISLPLITAFLLLNAAVVQDGGQNARSRMATLRAMHEQHTFRIDPHIVATSDWARTPSGAYYSNKAPGPMLLGFPAFLVLDRLHMWKERGYRDERGLRHFPDTFQATGTSLAMQALPFALLAAWVIHWLAGQGVSRQGQWFAGLAMLFGNTAACFMNSYFGHGITAVFTMAGLLALLERRWFWMSFSFGCALLSDYGFGMMIPAIGAAVFLRFRSGGGAAACPAILRGMVLGALIPAALWVWYHVAAFGGVFSIANKFQNPSFLDRAQEGMQLWGIFGLPDVRVLGLLFGSPERGIFPTQPWLLLVPLVSLALPRSAPMARVVAVFCLLGLAGMLLMNASFGGWHGGGGPGPRYLSHVFPGFAVWAGLVIDRAPRPVRAMLWGALLAAVLFRGLVYAGPLEAPVENLWAFYLRELGRDSYTPTLRLYLFGMAVAGAMAVSARHAPVSAEDRV
ncbi:MAG: hypothetical protein HUU37_04045 [Bdellovibrionales bacterium]|nr:hypothetical protein [Bdellovibrionales bacterium]